MEPDYRVPVNQGNAEGFSLDDSFEAIQPGLEVVDREGDKLGTVKRVYTPVTVDEQSSMVPEGYVRIGDRGLLSLGKDIYVPTSLVAGRRGDQLVLNASQDQLADMTLDRPEPLPADEE